MADEKELRVAAVMQMCKHFTGIQHDCCEVGVNYRELAGPPSLGMALRLPCLITKRHEASLVVTCSQLQNPTREEAEQEISESDAMVERVMLCAAVAHEDAKRKGFRDGTGGADSIPCPTECGGRLYYRVAGVNGHMHAKCDTKGCVSWME